MKPPSVQPPGATDPSLTAPVVGVQPLTARWESWMDDITNDPGRCVSLVEDFGSPVHVHNLEPFHRNIKELQDAARRSNVAFNVFFARKANKCIGYVDAAKQAGIAVDVAGEEELRQVLARGVAPDAVIVTSAVKPHSLLELCVEHGVCVAVDNDDEALALVAVARGRSTSARIAVRVHGFTNGERTLRSRFGVSVDDVVKSLARWSSDGDFLELKGLHFHLDGYAASDRVTALDAALDVADELANVGRPVEFIDMGGGFPMSYLDDQAEWDKYWRSLEAAVAGTREPITYENHGFGLIEFEGNIVGRRQAYPHAQAPVGGAWLSSILEAARPSRPDHTVAEAFQQRDLRLHCEPGRALLDGCGLTLARVEHRKQVGDDWLIGLYMNSSNCRSRKSELFADPRLVQVGERPGTAMTGYLTGAYCTESDLIMHRRLRFAQGVAVGDVVAFPNTAGYLMHFVESRSHQFELPLNVVLGPEGACVDPIDE